jgi:glycosyltransferase involved in cell wall biosynthesis
VSGKRELASVLHVAAGGDALGGVTQHLLSVVPLLGQHGFSAGIVFLREGLVPKLARARGIPTYVAPKRGRGDLLAIPRLAVLFERLRPAIVHTHTLSTNFYGRLAAGLARVPHRVTTVHSYMRDLLQYDPSGTIGNRLLFWHNQRATRRADRIIAVSEGVRSWLVDSGMPSARIHLVRCGVPLPSEDSLRADRQRLRGEWGLAEDQWVIGNVARAHPVKDQATLVEAAAPLLRDDPGARLVIAGDGPELPRLRARAQATGLGRRIMLLGAVAEGRALMATFDVFALSSRMEGLPLVVLEAMAARRPVVATDVGGLSELIEHGVSGLLVPAGAPDCLRAALVQIRSDAGQASCLGAAGRRIVEEGYDVNRTAEEVAAIYRDILRPQADSRRGRRVSS